jgi:ABC-type transport system substrate-binding protein
MLFDRVVHGQLDVVLDASPTVDQLRQLRSDPQLAGLLYENQISYVEGIQMNLAVPPLDDIHVRKAINLVLDRNELLGRWLKVVSGQPITEATGGGVIATHLAPDALEGGLLLGYRASWMDSAADGDLAAAQAEMRQSAYDRNGDGLCDAPTCKHVALVLTASWPRAFEPIVERDLAKIGIQVRVKTIKRYAPDGPLSAAAQSAMTANGWRLDYPSGAGFFPNLFSRPGFFSPLYFDFPLLGATSGELRGWGYSVLHVPSVDDRIRQCVIVTGQVQAECWARLDQYLMEKVVPWAPFMFQTAVRLVSRRVTHYSMDEFTGLPALDQIALAPSAIEGS